MVTPKNPVTLLITGARGFVGSHLAAHYLERGIRVIGVRRPQDSSPGDIPPSPYFRWLDWDLGSGLPDFPETIAAVIHCASRQPRAHLSETDYRRDNVESLGYLLDLMKKKGLKKIISFSSTAVHGDLPPPWNEKTDMKPLNPYASTKAEADLLLQTRAVSDGLSALCLRLPSLFGKGHEGGVVHTYYTMARKGEDFEIFSQGRIKRNLLYIASLIEACDLALDRLLRACNPGFDLFMLGSADEPSMLDIAQEIIRELKSPSHALPSNTESPIANDWVLDLSKSRSILGFKPITVKEGLRRFIKETGDTL